MELVGDRDDDGVDGVVGEHFVVGGIANGGLMDGDHAVQQVFGGVADRVQLGGLGFAAGDEVPGLSDLAAAEDSDVERGCVGAGHESAFWLSWNIGLRCRLLECLGYLTV